MRNASRIATKFTLASGLMITALVGQAGADVDVSNDDATVAVVAESGTSEVKVEISSTVLINGQRP